MKRYFHKIITTPDRLPYTMYLAWGEDTLDAGAAGWVRSVVGKKPNRIRIRWRTGAWTGETDTRGDAHRLRVARRGGGVLWGGMSARACACVKIFHGGWPWPTANRGPVGGVTKTGKSEEPTRNKIAVAAGHASGVCGGVPTPHKPMVRLPAGVQAGGRPAICAARFGGSPAR